MRNYGDNYLKALRNYILLISLKSSPQSQLRLELEFANALLRPEFETAVLGPGLETAVL